MKCWSRSCSRDPGRMPWVFAWAAVLAVATPVVLPGAAAPARPTGTPSWPWPGVDPRRLSGGLQAAIEGAVPTSPSRKALSLRPGAALPADMLDARIGPNRAVGADPDLLLGGLRGQAEPHIARSVSDPELLVAVFQEGRHADGGARDCGYGVSRDGGRTWTRALLPRLTRLDGGPYHRATDPVVGIDAAGRIYACTLVALDASFDTGAVVVSRSDDGGRTFGPPSTVFSPASTLRFPDKNWMAVNDFAGTPTAGRVVVTWTDFSRDSGGRTLATPLRASVSDDRGATWGAPVLATAAGANAQASYPLFLPDGSLGMFHIVWPDPNNLRVFDLHFQVSADGGLTFPGPIRTVARITGYDDPAIRTGLFIPAAAVARGTGDLFVVVAAQTGAGPRILLLRSTDRGATWLGPTTASDTPDGRGVFNPAVAVSADGRQVGVIYHDKRYASPSSPDHFVDLMVAHSREGGATFDPSVRVSDVTTDVRLAALTSSGYMIGDYVGLAAPAGPGAPPVAVWVDTRSGDADPYTARCVPAEPNDRLFGNWDYAVWKVAQFGAVDQAEPARSGTEADPDGDGLPNLVEMALGCDPLAPDREMRFGFNRIISLSSGKPGLGLSFVGRAGNSFGWETTSNGTDWVTVMPGQGVVTSVGGVKMRHGASFELASTGAQYRPRFTDPATGTTAAPAAGFAADSGSRLVNLSTRGVAGTGENILIGGFFAAGPADKGVLIRAAGPALAGFGVAGALADPQLAVFAMGDAAGSPPRFGNDNWSASAVASTANRVGAFPWTAGSRDAATLAALPPAGYTAQVSGVGGTSGVALVEVYDADAGGAARLTNLSTRGQVGTGEQILIGGFVVAGTHPKLLLLRAVGPGLGAYGVSGVLADPVLRVVRLGESSTWVANDDWGDAAGFGEVGEAQRLVGAFPLAVGSRDACLLVHLAPGAYTAQVSGAGGTTGIALFELYEVN